MTTSNKPAQGTKPLDPTQVKPTRIARQITELQAELTRLAATKTRRLEDQLTWRAPDIKALKIRAG